MKKFCTTPVNRVFGRTVLTFKNVWVNKVYIRIYSYTNRWISDGRNVLGVLTGPTWSVFILIRVPKFMWSGDWVYEGWYDDSVQWIWTFGRETEEYGRGRRNRRRGRLTGWKVVSETCSSTTLPDWDVRFDSFPLGSFRKHTTTVERQYRNRN